MQHVLTSGLFRIKVFASHRRQADTFGNASDQEACSNAQAVMDTVCAQAIVLLQRVRQCCSKARLTMSLQQERVNEKVRMVWAEPGPTGRAGPFQLLEEGLQETGLPRLLTSLPLPST